MSGVGGSARDRGPTGGIPEFEMPTEEPSPALDAASDATPEAPGVGSRSAIAEPGRAAQWRQVGWRHVVAAGVVGALLGAAVPASLEALGRAAADADVDRLRSVAIDYLAAVAERRADDATALVPLLRGAEAAAIASAELLAAARPIEQPDVRLVHIDGDVGTVEVRYRVGGREHARSLDAERIDGRWALLTSLAERATVQPFETDLPVSIAGVSLSERQVRLYPGTYELDLVEGPVFDVGGERVEIDGDPRTPAEIHVERRLSEPLAELAADYAVAAGARCQAASSCPIAEGALLGTPESAYVRSLEPDGRLLLGVPLVATAGTTSSWFEVSMRLTVDDEGRPVAWECGVPGAADGTLAPCSSLG